MDKLNQLYSYLMNQGRALFRSLQEAGWNDWVIAFLFVIGIIIFLALSVVAVFLLIKF